jgi:SAM-dependent methyltransferase
MHDARGTGITEGSPIRLGAIAESWIEWLALRGNAVPEPLVETQMAFSLARTVMAGVKLGVFEAVAERARTAVEIAAACGTHPGATEKLLGALAGSGYLTYRSGSYAPTRKTRKWLLRGSPTNLCDKLLFQFHEWDMVDGYESFVRTGVPIGAHGTNDDAAFWSVYQRGMRNLASLSADEVAARLPVPPGATDLLDIGGSHGHYSVRLCRRHPQLRSVVLDLPAAVAQAAPILAEENADGRVVHRPGNALTDDLGERSVDVVFMSQLVHHFTDAQNRALMKRIARALRPGGVCAMLDSIRPQRPGDGGQGAALLDLYFALTSESGTWPLETMQDWLREAGLRVERPIWLRTLPSGALVVGRASR